MIIYIERNDLLRNIVNRLEWLYNPSDAFVTCFCGLEGAQRSIAFLAF